VDGQSFAIVKRRAERPSPSGRRRRSLNVPQASRLANAAHPSLWPGAPLPAMLFAPRPDRAPEAVADAAPLGDHERIARGGRAGSGTAIGPLDAPDLGT